MKICPEWKEKKIFRQHKKTCKVTDYNFFQAKCRKLTCADSMMLTGDTCRPILEEMSEGSFAVTFRLVPSKGFIDVRIIQTIEFLLYEDISRALNTLSMDLDLQPIQIFLKLTQTLNSRRGTLSGALLHHIKKQ